MERRGLRGWMLRRPLGKLSDESRTEAEQVLYSPRAWLKGEQTSEGGQKLYPWEKLLWGVAATLRNAGAGFDNGRSFLWLTWFGVDPRIIFFQNLFNTLWDGFTDPLIGSYMDRHPWKDNTYRWIMRGHHTVWRIIYIFFLLDLGFNPVQRVVFYAVIAASLNITSTMRDISQEKYIAGLTPCSEERAKLFVWEHVFHKLGYMFNNVPNLMMGLIPQHHRVGRWNDYFIHTRGFLVAMPLMIAGGIIHTFLRNRVTFEHTVNATRKNEDGEVNENKLTLRESFAVLKHNKFLLYWLIANGVNQLIPEINTSLVWRFLVPPVANNFVRGPAMTVLFGQISGLPITFLAPFMRQIVHGLGGPKRTMVLGCIAGMVARGGQFAIGLNTPAAIFGHFLFDTIRETVSPISEVANRTMGFEMLDYVEYKTGVRSEGINRSIVGFIEKTVKNNVSSFTGNFLQSWMGVHYLNEAEPDEYGHYHIPADSQAQRFARWAVPVWLLGDVLRGAIMLVARASFPYKYGQNVEIEAELAARRAAEAQAREQIEEDLAQV